MHCMADSHANCISHRCYTLYSGFKLANKSNNRLITLFCLLTSWYTETEYQSGRFVRGEEVTRPLIHL